MKIKKYLEKKVEEIEKSLKKFTKKKDWKTFRAKVNKEKKNV